MFRNMDFVLGNTFCFNDRFGADPDSFSGSGESYKVDAVTVWDTNFVPNVRTIPLHLRRNRGADLTMDVEDAGQLAVVVLRPQVDLILHSNQLSRDPNSLSIAPHAALKYVVHAQFLADSSYRFIRLLVCYGRGSCDHSHAMRRHLPQSHDGLLAQAIAKILLRRIATHVFKWKNREHDASALRFNLHRQRLDSGGANCLALETIPFAEHGLDVLRVAGVVSQRSADLSDGGVNAVIRVEVEVLPRESLNNFLAADQPSLFEH